MAQALSGAAGRSAASLGLERVSQMASEVEPGDGRCQDDGQDDGSGQGGESHSNIEGDVSSQRQLIGAQRTQETDSASPGRDPEQPSNQREQHGLDHRFAHHVPSARAQCLPDGQFLGSTTGTDEKQVHKIDCADQEKSKYAGLQQQ